MNCYLARPAALNRSESDCYLARLKSIKNHVKMKVIVTLRGQQHKKVKVIVTLRGQQHKKVIVTLRGQKHTKSESDCHLARPEA